MVCGAAISTKPRGTGREPSSAQPESRRNEILSLMESGLEDISVTRSGLKWAIPFPRPTTTGEVQSSSR